MPRRAQTADAGAIGRLPHDLNAEHDEFTPARRPRQARRYESLGFSNREGKPDGPLSLFYERELP